MAKPLICPLGHPLALRGPMEAFLRDGLIQENGHDVVFIDMPFEKLCPLCGLYYQYQPEAFRTAA